MADQMDYIAEEDYPGQRDEIRRQRIIEQAVSAADVIIMDGSSGEVQETDYLTGMVAQKFLEKVSCRLTAELLKKNLQDRYMKHGKKEDLMKLRGGIQEGG